MILTSIILISSVYQLHAVDDCYDRLKANNAKYWIWVPLADAEYNMYFDPDGAAYVGNGGIGQTHGFHYTYSGHTVTFSFPFNDNNNNNNCVRLDHHINTLHAGTPSPLFVLNGVQIDYDRTTAGAKQIAAGNILVRPIQNTDKPILWVGAAINLHYGVYKNIDHYYHANQFGQFSNYQHQNVFTKIIQLQNQNNQPQQQKNEIKNHNGIVMFGFGTVADGVHDTWSKLDEFRDVLFRNIHLHLKPQKRTITVEKTKLSVITANKKKDVWTERKVDVTKKTRLDIWHEKEVDLTKIVDVYSYFSQSDAIYSQNRWIKQNINPVVDIGAIEVYKDGNNNYLEVFKSTHRDKRFSDAITKYLHAEHEKRKSANPANAREKFFRYIMVEDNFDNFKTYSDQQWNKPHENGDMTATWAMGVNFEEVDQVILADLPEKQTFNNLILLGDEYGIVQNYYQFVDKSELQDIFLCIRNEVMVNLINSITANIQDTRLWITVGCNHCGLLNHWIYDDYKFEVLLRNANNRPIKSYFRGNNNLELRWRLEPNLAARDNENNQFAFVEYSNYYDSNDDKQQLIVFNDYDTYEGYKEYKSSSLSLYLLILIVVFLMIIICFGIGVFSGILSMSYFVDRRLKQRNKNNINQVCLRNV